MCASMTPSHGLIPKYSLLNLVYLLIIKKSSYMIIVDFASPGFPNNISNIRNRFLRATLT